MIVGSHVRHKRSGVTGVVRIISSSLIVIDRDFQFVEKVKPFHVQAKAWISLEPDEWEVV